MADLIRAPMLSALAGIGHAFFTRKGGVSDGLYKSLNAGIGSNDAPANVSKNRARMAGAVGVRPDCLLTCYQIHSPEVVTVTKPWPADARPRADALVTSVPGLAIAVSTADCGPVLLADERARVVGAAHAGWRGAFTGVIEATLKAMEQSGAERANIVAALGPMIRQSNYEVGPEFIARFKADDDIHEQFFRPAGRAGHALFDLAGYITARLIRAGVTRIQDVDRCTYADPETYFSYRRSVHRGESDYGRHLNAIALSD
jgi:polyphenol oxidase